MKVEYLNKAENTFQECKEFIQEWNKEEEYILQKTSGSTGQPKQIKVLKSKILASAKATGDFFNLENFNSVLLCISPKFIGGKMLIVRAIKYNLNIICAPIDNNPLKDLNTKIDFVSMVPLQVKETLDKNPEKFNFVEIVIIGGAPVQKDLIDKLQSFKTRFYSTYGMTETVSHIALKPLNNKKVENLNDKYLAIGQTYFEEENGNLIINAPHLGISSLKTNDLVELYDDKSFKWIGRSDFIINSGGIKVIPEKIEDELSRILTPNTFMISSKKDKILGEKVVLISTKKVDKKKIKEYLLNKGFRYEVPKEIIISDDLLRLPNGKINRLENQKLINS